MYIYDRSTENAGVYLPRPRQCLPIAYVIYHKQKPVPRPIVAVYHFHCSGSRPSSEMIDLTCDDDNEDDIVSSTAAPIASENTALFSQPSVDNASSQTLESLEMHFMSLAQDMITTQSQQQQNSSSAVISAAASTSPGVIRTSNVSPSVDSNADAFRFPVYFSSAATSTTERPRETVSRFLSQQTAGQPPRPATVRTSLAGRVIRTVTPRISTQSVGSTFLTDWQRNTSLSQYINALSARSTGSTSIPQSAVGSASQSTLQASSSSIGSPLRFIPLSVVASSNTALHAVGLNSMRSSLAFLPYSASGVQIPNQPSTEAYRGAVPVQSGATRYLQQPRFTPNYNAFRLQREQQLQQPLALILPQVVTATTQRQLNVPSVCASYAVNLTSVCFTQPAPSVMTVPSQYQLLRLSVTSTSSLTSSALPQTQARHSVPSVSSCSLAQISTHAWQSASILQQPSVNVNVTWTAGTAGGQLASTSESQPYASNAIDEFVDIESITAEQFAPIVIAPDNCTDDGDRPAEYAEGDVTVKEEPVSSVRKSLSRRLHEVICIDDDERHSAAVLTDATDSEYTVNDESVADDTSIDDFDLPPLLSNYDDIPAINIVPDDRSCSPVQTGDLLASFASSHVHCPMLSPMILSKNSTFSLPNSDTTNVGRVPASCIASDSVLSTILPSTCASVGVNTDGMSFARSVESAGIMSPSCAPSTGLVYCPQNTGERTSVHTVHHLPQSYVDIRPVSASVLANSVLQVSSASVFYSNTPPPVMAASVSIPMLLTVLPSVGNVPTLLPSQLAPMNSTPLVTLATQAPSVVRTCDVTAMATQLVSGLRSDAMRRRATSAAKAAVHQSSESESSSAGSRKRLAGSHVAGVPAKTWRHTPPILNRSRSQTAAKEPANELTCTSLPGRVVFPITSGMIAKSVGSSVTSSHRTVDYLSRFVNPLPSLCSSGYTVTSQSATSHTSVSVIGSITARKDIGVSPANAGAKMKKSGETVMYHLHEDGSIEIRIQKGSISETASRSRKQTLQPGGFDAVVELDSSASQSWCSETFVTDMGKYFNNLKVVKLSGNDSATSDKSLHVPELDTVSPGKQKVTEDTETSLPTLSSRELYDDVEPDSDSRDTLSLIIDEEDWQLAVDDEGEDSSGLKITNVCSLNAEAFTDLNEHVILPNSSVASDVPRDAVSAADDKNTFRQSFSVVSSSDVSGVAVNASEDSDSSQVHNEHHHSSDTNAIHVDNSSSSTDCHLVPVPTCNDSSFGDDQENDADLEGEEVSRLDSSGDTSLFEISLNSDEDTDSEATLSPSNEYAENTAEALSNLTNAESNNQQAVEQKALFPSDEEIYPAAQLSSADGETVEQPRDEVSQLSASEDVTSPVIRQLPADHGESATDVSEVLREHGGGTSQLITEMSSSISRDFERQESRVSCPQRNDAGTENDTVSHTCSNMDPTNDAGVHSQLHFSDGEGSLLSSHGDNTVNVTQTSSDCLTECHVKNMNQDQCLSSAREERGGSGISGIKNLRITTEDRLHQLDNVAGGQQHASATVMPETKKSKPPTSHVNYSYMTNTDPVSPPSEPCVIVSDCGDVKSDNSSSPVVGRLEMKSVSATEELEVPMHRDCRSLPDIEPVSPPLDESASDTDALVSETMATVKLDHQIGCGYSNLVDTELVCPILEISSLPERSVEAGQESSSPPLLAAAESASSTRCTNNSSLMDAELVSPLLELTYEFGHSSESMTGPLLPVSKKLEAKAVRGKDNRIDTEAVLAALSSVSVSDTSASSTRLGYGRVSGAEPVTAVDGVADDTDTHICDVELDDAAVISPPGPVAEKLNVCDMEQASGIHSEQACDLNTNLYDVERADTSTDDELENQKFASATKYNMVDMQSISALPEAPVVSSHPQKSVSLPVLVTEKSFSPASNANDTCPVSPVQEPIHDVAANLCERKRDKSSRSLNVACLPSLVTEATKHGSSESCAVKSASLCVYVKSFDVTPVSSNWLSDMLSAPRAVSESRDKCTRSDVHSRREDAFVKLCPASASTRRGVQQSSESHRAGSSTVSVTKAPKRITLADYRNRKSASQVDVSDKSCQRVEPSRVSCEATSAVSSTSVAEVSSESHTPCSSVITSNSDDVVVVDNPSQECTDAKISDNSDLSSTIAAGGDLQETAVPPPDVDLVADVTGSSSCPVNIDLDAQTEEEMNTSNDVDDSTKTTKIYTECGHRHQSEIQTVEARANDGLPADSRANDDAFHIVNKDNIGPRNPSSPNVTDEVTTNCVDDSHSTKLSPENTETLCSPVSDVEPFVVNDDQTEAVDIDSAVAQSLTGTDEEILDDVLLDNVIAGGQETKAERKCLLKKRKAARKPWNFSLVAVDVDNFSEPATFCGSGDIRTLPKHLRCGGHFVLLKDSPVTIPTEPLDAHSPFSDAVATSGDNVVGSYSFDNALCTVTNSSLMMTSLKNADASSPSAGKDEQLLYCCDKNSLFTDSKLTLLVSSNSKTSYGQHYANIAEVTEKSAKTEDTAALKPDVLLAIEATSSSINKQVKAVTVEGVSVSACTESARNSENSLSPSSAIVVTTDTEPSESGFKITDGQHVAGTPGSSISNLSQHDSSSSHSTTTTEFGPVAIPGDSLVKINTLTGLARIPDSEILHTAVTSAKPLESHTQNSADTSEVTSRRDDQAECSSKECTGQGSRTALVLEKDGRKGKEPRPKVGHIKAATMWKDSMHDWVNVDMSKNRDIVVPKYTLSNDYFVVRQNAFRLLKSVAKLAKRTKTTLKDRISSSLKEMQNLLDEELVYVDVAAQLDSTEAKLLAEKQLRMTDFLCSVETQLRDLSVELYGMTDAEAELSCYEKADWSSESDLHYNILLLTRHMLYKEMSSLRCYHNCRLVYRLPDELCLDVERDRFVSVEGCVLFLEYSMLSLAECRQLFALKVAIEEAQYNLAQLDGTSFLGSEEANRLGWLHFQRRQKLDCLSVKSLDSLRTLQTFLTQQLDWYRYVSH